MQKMLLLLLTLLLLPAGVFAQEDEEWVEFTSSDGTVSFRHPAAWVVLEEQGGYYLVPEEAINTKLEDREPLVDGEFGLGLIFFPNAQVTFDPASESYYVDLLMSLNQLIVPVPPTEATADPEATAETTAAATTEPTVEATEAAPDSTAAPEEALPFTLEPYGTDNYTLTLTETGQVYYGYDSNDGRNDYSLMVFEADADHKGVVLIYTPTGGRNRDQVLEFIEWLASVTYTPAAE